MKPELSKQEFNKKYKILYAVDATEEAKLNEDDHDYELTLVTGAPVSQRDKIIYVIDKETDNIVISIEPADQTELRHQLIKKLNVML